MIDTRKDVKQPGTGTTQPVNPNPETDFQIASSTSAYYTGESQPASGSSAPQTPAVGGDSPVTKNADFKCGAKTACAKFNFLKRSAETKTAPSAAPCQSVPNVSKATASAGEKRVNFRQMLQSTKCRIKVNQ